MINRHICFGSLCMFFLFLHIDAAIEINMKNFGAAGNGTTLDTKIIQKAIDSCTKAGGGTVLFSGGSFLSGTIYLKSNVSLKIDAGATLLGSGDINQYTTDTYMCMYNGESYQDRCFIFAKDAMNVGIIGKGTVDGQGKSLPDVPRPMMLRFLNCTNVTIRGVKLSNPGAYTSVYHYCKNVVFDSITVSARAKPNGDGCDFDGCDGVIVSNCEFDCSDDAMCLQTSKKNFPCKNVKIFNCHTTVARGGALRIGLLSVGDFDSVEVYNCRFDGLKDCGFKIQECEGGKMSNFNFHDIEIINSPRICFMTLNSFRFSRLEVDSGHALPPINANAFSNIKYTNIKLTNGAANGDANLINSYSAILGTPGHTLDNITFDNITFNAPGGGSSTQAARRNLAEITDKRPEPSIIGVNPGYGVYMHHARNITIQNSVYKTLSTDARCAIVGEDATNVNIVNNTIQGCIDCPGYKTGISGGGLSPMRPVFTSGSGAFSVYTPAGRLVRSMDLTSGAMLTAEMRRAKIPAGLYIVKTASRDTRSLQTVALQK